MDKYDFKKIEKKWQADWKKKGIYEPNLKGKGKRKPFYQLMMFPYPSAEGLHVGNMYAFTGSDVYGRLKRMQGYDVFEPIGLDGFGIHSENYALKVGTHPAKQAAVSEKRFYKQLESIGGGFAWNERLETYDPEYYKWTQWLFIQMFKAGFAYRKKQPVNWCPSCKTVLADEQVIAGKCERCNSVVEKRDLEQWFFRITKYADKLLKNLDSLDWTEKVKIAQKNWIGKSEGAEIDFEIEAPFSGKVMVFASNNAGKVKRMRNLLKAAGLDIELKTPAELGIEDFDVEESGETLREDQAAYPFRRHGFLYPRREIGPSKGEAQRLKGIG
jgi:leucyl-tRNA synthetase